MFAQQTKLEYVVGPDIVWHISNIYYLSARYIAKGNRRSWQAGITQFYGCILDIQEFYFARPRGPNRLT